MVVLQLFMVNIKCIFVLSLFKQHTTHSKINTKKKGCLLCISLRFAISCILQLWLLHSVVWIRANARINTLAKIARQKKISIFFFTSIFFENMHKNLQMQNITKNKTKHRESLHGWQWLNCIYANDAQCTIRRELGSLSLLTFIGGVNACLISFLVSEIS